MQLAHGLLPGVVRHSSGGSLLIKLIKNGDVYAPEHLGTKDVLIIGEKIGCIGDAIRLDLPTSVPWRSSMPRGSWCSRLHRWPCPLDRGRRRGGLPVPDPGDPSVQPDQGRRHHRDRLPWEPTASPAALSPCIAKAKRPGGRGHHHLHVHRSLPHSHPDADRQPHEGHAAHRQGGGGRERWPSRTTAPPSPTLDELKRLAADIRVGGILSGKAGVLNIHLGDGAVGLQLLRELVATTEIPPFPVPAHPPQPERATVPGGDRLCQGGRLHRPHLLGSRLPGGRGCQGQHRA